MIPKSLDWLLAVVGGVLLALMIYFNSVMAHYSTPLFAAWVAHGVGILASIVFLFLFTKNVIRKKQQANKHIKIPLWCYLGGIPGAMTLVLSAIAINSSLKLSATLALMLVGQILFGIVADRFGLFGSLKRKLTLNDLCVVVSVLLGSALIIYFTPSTGLGA